MSTHPPYGEKASYPPPHIAPPYPTTLPPPPQTAQPPQPIQRPSQGVFPLSTYPPQPVPRPPQPVPCPPQVVPSTTYSPQPPKYPSRQGAAKVVVNRPPNAVRLSVSFSDAPMLYNCHICHTQQVTKVTYQYGTFFWIVVLVLCLFLGPLAFLALFFDGMKDAYHTCPNCHNVVGVYQRCSPNTTLQM